MIEDDTVETGSRSRTHQTAAHFFEVAGTFFTHYSKYLLHGHEPNKSEVAALFHMTQRAITATLTVERLAAGDERGACMAIFDAIAPEGWFAIFDEHVRSFECRHCGEVVRFTQTTIGRSDEEDRAAIERELDHHTGNCTRVN